MQPVSCYERLRLQNIERNQLFLKNLGLETNVSTIAEGKQSKAKRKIETIEDSFDARRSHRIANIPALTSYKEVGSFFQNSIVWNLCKTICKHIFYLQVNDEPSLTSRYTGKGVLNKGTGRAANPKSRQEPPPDSSRMMDANLDYFFGATDQECRKDRINSSANKSSLGETIDAYGKAAVMAAANNGIQPRFSKYSGVCEWRNCVFLWVNIMKAACKGGYNNTFNEKGRFMTWFGGSKMSEGKLLHTFIWAVYCDSLSFHVISRSWSFTSKSF